MDDDEIDALLRASAAQANETAEERVERYRRILDRVGASEAEKAQILATLEGRMN